jgi:telomere length regulation protein
MDDISKRALDAQSETAAATVPELIRHRRLRIQKPRGVTEIPEQQPNYPLNPYSSLEHHHHQAPATQPKTRFIDVAAEFFIVPLIHRFWAFLRDEQTREERTAHKDSGGRARYAAAGTGLILNPLVLAQFLRTLAILVNASQNAPEWLAIIAPESLELAVTMGTRPVSHMDTDTDPEGDVGGGGGLEERRQSKEASVLTSALELALVVLDGALEIDGGRILSLEHTTLVFGLEEWAGKVFASLEKGIKVLGGGGVHEAKLSRAAAGVLLKVDEMTSKWRRSMLDTR